MFIQSRTPDKIPGLYLWYDFSDRSTLDGGGGYGSIADNHNILSVKNKAINNVSALYGDRIANATNLCSTYTYTDPSSTVISLTAGDYPTWYQYGINGLGSVFFGGNTSSKGYSNVLTTSFVYQWDVEYWYPYGGIPPTGPENYIGPIKDRERSIFIVYVTATTSGYNDNINVVDMYSTSVMGTQLPGSGNFGCVFDIHAPVYYWIQNDDTSTIWYDQVSYMNLIKYNNDSEFSYLNFLPDQGFTMVSGYPANDPSYTHRIDNPTGNCSLFQFRSRDSQVGYLGLSPVPVSEITKTHVNVSTTDLDTYQNLQGIVCTTAVDTGPFPTFTIIPDRYNIGIYYGHFSLGNSSRFWNSVPSDLGMISGISTPAVDPTYQSGFNGYIGEVVYYNRRLTDLETRHVREYLRKKWNIGQLGLPGGVGFDVIGTTLVVY